MLHIVIPMAGRGARFAQAGFTDPKPLIPVGGQPMVEWVVENVRPARAHRFYFLCLGEHLARYPRLALTLRELAPNCEIIPVSGVTEGAACTVLLARSFINDDQPLLLANSDQWVAAPIDDFLARTDQPGLDGLIMTFWADHPKWSYCRRRPDGTVSEVVEKQVVSNDATVGIYHFARGADFVRGADAMIARNFRVNNEFYVAPVYNELLAAGARVEVFTIPVSDMHGLGVPEDLAIFQRTAHFHDRKRAED
jgi:NDP-sugar pyrophosphorylase family protein